MERSVTKIRLNKTWAITCFFNPCRYENKPENYRVFRKNLARQGVPLIAVECAFNGLPFELTDSDADVLVQVRSNSILWQKERLLNIALKHVPADCENIIWIDADIIFPDDAWLTKTEKALETYEVIQPFDQAVRLTKSQKIPSESELKRLIAKAGKHVRQSFGYVFQREGVRVTDYGPAGGFAWAAKKRLFDSYGFYDLKIIGGGDWIMAKAFAGIANRKPQQNEAWIEAVSAAVGGRFSYAPNQAIHLFHGSRAERRYGGREAILLRNHFDAKKDLRINSDGCFEWTVPDSQLAKEVQEYFAMRNEEGNVFQRATFMVRGSLDAAVGATGLFLQKHVPPVYAFLKKIVDVLPLRL